jgi:hypothetical protein
MNPDTPHLLWSLVLIPMTLISLFLRGVVSAPTSDVTEPAPDDPRVIATLLEIQVKQLTNARCRGEGQSCQSTDDCCVCLRGVPFLVKAAPY